MADGGRYRWLRRIEALDPVRDHHEIYRISIGYEFPFDYQRALELALLRTYCVPSISALLDATGEFRLRAQQRYDDTALLMAEMAEHGYDSPRGRQALKVINRAHHRYVISNDDMRYVLSTFVYEPIEWLDRFGWRRLHEHERLAAFHYYRAVGTRMGIRDVPDDFDAFWDFKREYEHTAFRYAPTNQRIAEHTLDLFGSWYPRPLRRGARLGVVALLPAELRAAFGLPAAPRWLSTVVTGGLRARAGVVRMLPPRRTSRLTHAPRNRTYPGYPHGYQLTDLGAPPPPPDLDPALTRGGPDRRTRRPVEGVDAVAVPVDDDPTP
ncbi:oxygenase MpaB family protein [Micromonospora sp. NPDC049051]|uniref:oxygenase MpaB family protein n=1 Tax=Micromonospora sp. NPDC049051 TaxID=3364264 RepID=UPI0037171B3C